MNEQNIGQMMSMMGQDGGMKQMLLSPSFQDEETGHSFSQADLMADVINILRMDTKRIGETHDVEIAVSKMTPHRAAELLESMAKGEEQLNLIEIFDEIEEQRMDILEAATDRETVEEFMQTKRWVLNSVPDDPVEHHETQEETTDAN